MGYEVHITRREMFFEEEGGSISLDEWKDYVSKDSEMRLDGYAEAETPDGVLRVEDESLAVFLGWSKHEKDGGIVWMHHFEGNISYKNPDEEILKKIYHVAVALEARLQGDEGEIYDEYGESNWQELKEQGDAMTKELTKKWWPFWK